MFMLSVGISCLHVLLVVVEGVKKVCSSVVVLVVVVLVVVVLVIRWISLKSETVQGKMI